MASPRLSDPFNMENQKYYYQQLCNILDDLEHWATMLPSFSTDEISQILPYLTSKTEDLANHILAGTRIEQTNTLKRLSVLRQGRLGNLNQCKDHINVIFRAQLQLLRDDNAAPRPTTNNAATSTSEPMSTPSIVTPFTTSQPAHETFPKFCLPRLSVRHEAGRFVHLLIAEGPYSLTTTFGRYTVCSRPCLGSTITYFVKADVTSVIWDTKSGIVNLKIASGQNTGWNIEFEACEDAKTVAYALMS